MMSLRHILAMVLACGACTETPTQPTAVFTAPTLQQRSTVPVGTPPWHGMPAVSDGQFAPGQIVWVCATQPRAYAAPDGTVTEEVDTYIADNPCPKEPIP